MAVKFFKCPHCGNVIVKAVDGGVTPVCCGETMKELNPRAQDGAAEKHVPQVTKVDDCTIKVEVGSVPHPMTPEHHIAFIFAETDNGGGQLVKLDPAKPAVAEICVCKTPVVAVYESCNLHGLWVKEI